MSTTMGPPSHGPIYESDVPSPGWLVVGGSVLSLVALFLLLFPAVSSASVTILTGVCLVVGGVGMIVAALLSRAEGGVAGALILGGLLTLAGVLLWSDVLAGTATLTAILIAWLIADGVVGLLLAFVQRAPSWGLGIVTSLVSLTLGILLWAHWPTSAEWVLGVYAGVILLMRGISLVAAGLVLRHATN